MSVYKGNIYKVKGFEFFIRNYRPVERKEKEKREREREEHRNERREKDGRKDHRDRERERERDRHRERDGRHRSDRIPGKQIFLSNDDCCLWRSRIRHEVALYSRSFYTLL